jgi:hypothetical protein
MSKELIKNEIESIAKLLPLDAEGFRMKVEEMLSIGISAVVLSSTLTNIRVL